MRARHRVQMVGVVGLALASGLWAQAPKGKEPLLLAGGKLRLDRPGSFETIGHSADAAQVNFRSRGGMLLVSITALPQQGTMQNAQVRQRLIDEMLESLQQEGKGMNAEVVTAGAAVENEPLLYAKVTDTIKVGGRTLTRSKSLRLVGRFVISAYIAATDEDAKHRAAMVLEAEDKIIRQVEINHDPKTAGTPAKVTTVQFKRAGLKFNAPAEWTATVTDAPAGVLAVLVNAAQPRTKIVVTSVRLEPKDGTVSREILNVAMDKAVEIESAKLALGAPVGEFETAVDGRFLRRSRRTGGQMEAPWTSDTRQVRVGNAVVSVAMVCLPGDEEEAARAADDVAESLGVGG